MQTKKIRKLTLTAILLAFVLLFGLTPLGLIPLGFINVTILCLPVIIGTIHLGLGTGLMLGFFFGTVSLFSMLGWSLIPPSTLAGNLLAASPVLAILMCYVPRLLVPLVAHLVYRALQPRIRVHAAIPAAAAAGSLTNTVFYLGLMFLFYNFSGLDTTKVVNLILGVAFIAGSSEAVVVALLSLPILLALRKIKV